MDWENAIKSFIFVFGLDVLINTKVIPSKNKCFTASKNIQRISNQASIKTT